MENKAGLMLLTNSYGRNLRGGMLKFALNRANVAFGCRHLGVEEDHCDGSRTF